MTVVLQRQYQPSTQDRKQERFNDLSEVVDVPVTVVPEGLYDKDTETLSAAKPKKARQTQRGQSPECTTRV